MTRYNPGSSIPTYVKYAFIPQDPCWSFARTDPATGKLVRNPGYSPYGYDPAMSPTGDPSTDSMASVLAHEVMEVSANTRIQAHTIYIQCIQANKHAQDAVAIPWCVCACVCVCVCVFVFVFVFVCAYVCVCVGT